ncbi:MAG: class I SAM-dependent methyltransferase [Fibrobacterota bacterium]|nr:class I SAM-dependent methyltransferase [Fibrobacterota bacterium]QQS03695.1 MAG: class I SAM-dependent methyltransferase [Fibrobacterota bacterium]
MDSYQTESTQTCPICSATQIRSFSHQVLGKHEVAYFYCSNCGLLNTEQPYWLDEAYEEAIIEKDTGLVARNLANAKTLAWALPILGKGSGKLLDVAGGYGLLARLLRDRGFDCFTTDKFCKNLFAKEFEPREDFTADALFAFEVLEHIPDPLLFVSDLFTKFDCKTFIFSTQTFSETPPPPDWWYYVFECGQHISFYQPRTLKLMASKLGCRHYLLEPGLHLFTNETLCVKQRILLFNSLAKAGSKSIHKLRDS